MHTIIKQKNVLLAVSGSIAAFKVLELVSLLKKQNINLKVILTKNAERFTPKLSYNAMLGEDNTFIEEDLFTKPMLHIELARWADIMVVVPASASIIAKMTHGLADNLLVTTYLLSAKTAVVPAMNPTMWGHLATQQNVTRLKQHGVDFWGPVRGVTACGDEGEGRMIEPFQIKEHILSNLHPKPLLNKSVLITAGPTVEQIDSVRFMSNYSSGKMGFALARAASFLGANVTIIAGPVSLDTPLGCKRIDVISAQDMLQSILKESSKGIDILIMAAAVSDFTPSNVLEGKSSKKDFGNSINITVNPDLLAEITKIKPRPFCVGFALEQDSEGLLAKAHHKLNNKQADLIIANSISKNTGFNVETNQVTVIGPNQFIEALALKNKSDLAFDILQTIISQFKK